MTKSWMTCLVQPKTEILVSVTPQVNRWPSHSLRDSTDLSSGQCILSQVVGDQYLEGPGWAGLGWAGLVAQVSDLAYIMLHQLLYDTHFNKKLLIWVSIYCHKNIVVLGGMERKSLASEIEETFNVIIQKQGDEPSWESGQQRVREVVVRCTGKSYQMLYVEGTA